jgi:ubiquinol-cytochrome c reductase cytochrome c subunit
MASPAAARLSLVVAAWCGVALAAPAAALAQPDAVRGRTLYVDSCASCHGDRGEGTGHGPALTDSGAAAADFYLRTGRMPLASSNDQAVRKDPAFSDADIAAIVAYVGSLGSGPPVPEVFPETASLELGASLYIGNCAPCHGAGGNGGAAGRNAIAPGLHRATPVQIAEAVIVGPGQMPRFGFSQRELDAVVAYVDHLDDAEDPGGADIGGIGPVPEGFVAWGVGMLSLLVVSLLIGSRRKRGQSP